jgi:hypothetical protein
MVSCGADHSNQATFLSWCPRVRVLVEGEEDCYAEVAKKLVNASLKATHATMMKRVAIAAIVQRYFQ